MTAVILRSSVAIEDHTKRVTFYVYNPFSEFAGTELEWEYLGTAVDCTAIRRINRHSPILITITGNQDIPALPQVYAHNMREATDFFGALAILILDRLNIRQDEAGLAAISERIHADAMHAAPFEPPF